jgi:hypothetical protein
VARGLGDVEFDAVATLLDETLRELDVAEDLIAEVGAIVASMRDRVLGRAVSPRGPALRSRSIAWCWEAAPTR